MNMFFAPLPYSINILKMTLNALASLFLRFSTIDSK